MAVQLDHLILPVNDRVESLEFYASILGFRHEGEDGPFTVVRVAPELTLLIAPWGTAGGMHLAFSMSQSEFDDTLQRVRDAGVPFGDGPHDVGNMLGPGDETGSRGLGKALYFFDPSQHLIEIRHYES